MADALIDRNEVASNSIWLKQMQAIGLVGDGGVLPVARIGCIGRDQLRRPSDVYPGPWREPGDILQLAARHPGKYVRGFRSRR